MTDERHPIRVVLVDDQALVRAGFRALLEAEQDVDVVAEAGAGDAAVVVVTATEPDIVLMDLRMPGMNGIEATRRIRQLDDPPHVLVLTTFDTDENVFDALEAGGAVISPATTRRLVDHLVAFRAGLVHPMDRGHDALHPGYVEDPPPRGRRRRGGCVASSP